MWGGISRVFHPPVHENQLHTLKFSEDLLFRASVLIQISVLGTVGYMKQTSTQASSNRGWRPSWKKLGRIMWKSRNGSRTVVVTGTDSGTRSTGTNAAMYELWDLEQILTFLYLSFFINKHPIYFTGLLSGLRSNTT